MKRNQTWPSRLCLELINNLCQAISRVSQFVSWTDVFGAWIFLSDERWLSFMKIIIKLIDYLGQVLNNLV